MKIFMIILGAFAYLLLVMLTLVVNLPLWLMVFILVILPSIVYGLLLMPTLRRAWHCSIHVARKKPAPEPAKKPLTDALNLTLARRILNVEAFATEQEIHQSFREIMRILHPDNGGPSHLAKMASEAKTLLLKQFHIRIHPTKSSKDEIDLKL